MAFKEAPKVDAKELYYQETAFIIRWLDDTIYGNFFCWSNSAMTRSKNWKDAMKFETYEEAAKAIADNMLEGVTIMKVYY